MHVFPSGALRSMRSPLSPAVRCRAAEEDPRWRSKACLRAVALIAGVVTIGLFAASVAATNAAFTPDDGSPGDWTDGLALAPTTWGLLVDALVLLAQFGFRRGSPLSPAILLPLDLVAWGAMLAGVVVAVGGGIFWYWAPAVPNGDGSIDCGTFFNAFAAECDPLVYTIGRMEIAASVFLVILFVIHFVLFALDCLDLHRRRRTARAAREFDMRIVKDVERGSSSRASSA